MSDIYLQLNFNTVNRTPRQMGFRNPLSIVTTHCIEGVIPAIQRLQDAQDSGYYAAGYIAYEAASAFDPALKTQPTTGPLLWFGIFSEPSIASVEADDNLCIPEWKPETSKVEYEQNVEQIREAIASGETYQVNLSTRLRADFKGDPTGLYTLLKDCRNGDYSALLDMGEQVIVSFSPELFFSVNNGVIRVCPMKGTVPRGRWRAEDLLNVDRLQCSEKEQAENVMIVDLMRNDLGHISTPGSVNVTELFRIEQYPTVWQMTSSIEARLLPNTKLEQILKALFPCGSVTGAPKVTAMRRIAGMERSPRGVYCGAVGYIEPIGNSIFNVAIRTASFNRGTHKAEYGAGGAVTWDSTPTGEYAEMVSKTELLNSEHFPDFELLESMLLENGAIYLEEQHIQRMNDSADYFQIQFSEQQALAALEMQRLAHPTGSWKLRMLLNRDGEVKVECEPLKPFPVEPVTAVLSQLSVHSSSKWLYHKTTNRALYEHQRMNHPHAFEVLMQNERCELTEFLQGNLMVQLEGVLYTPPLDCGLLPGVMRTELLASGGLQERVLYPSDLPDAEGIWMLNSVRMTVRVELQGE